MLDEAVLDEAVLDEAVLDEAALDEARLKGAGAEDARAGIWRPQPRSPAATTREAQTRAVRREAPPESGRDERAWPLERRWAPGRSLEEGAAEIMQMSFTEISGLKVAITVRVFPALAAFACKTERSGQRAKSRSSLVKHQIGHLLRFGAKSCLFPLVGRPASDGGKTERSREAA